MQGGGRLARAYQLGTAAQFGKAPSSIVQPVGDEGSRRARRSVGVAVVMGNRCCGSRSATGLRDRQTTAYLPRQSISDLGVSRNRLDVTGVGVALQRVRRSFPLEEAAMLAEVSEKGSPLHPTVMISRIASAGTPRRASVRRSSRIKTMASRRLSRHSSFVLP